jgi:hypothetical protein
MEVIKAELKAVMNTLTEYNIQDAFRNGRSAWNGAYMQKGTTLRVMVASRPKVIFDQITATVPEITDITLYVDEKCVWPISTFLGIQAKFQ